MINVDKKTFFLLITIHCHHLSFKDWCRKYKWYFLCFLVNNCPVGYTGGHCKTPCSYPKYGKGCQNVCACSKRHCDVSKGCHLHSGRKRKWNMNISYICYCNIDLLRGKIHTLKRIPVHRYIIQSRNTSSFYYYIVVYRIKFHCY